MHSNYKYSRYAKYPSDVQNIVVNSMQNKYTLNKKSSVSLSIPITNASVSKVYINPKMNELQERIPKVHINPLFKNAHINPYFRSKPINHLNAAVHLTNVHINPKLLQVKCGQNIAGSTTELSKTAVSLPATNSSCDQIDTAANPYKFVSKSKLIKNVTEKIQSIPKRNVNPLVNTKNKLIRVQSLKPKNGINFLQHASIIKMSPRKRRQSLQTKYTIVHNSDKQSRTNKTFMKNNRSNYKIDRRVDCAMEIITSEGTKFKNLKRNPGQSKPILKIDSMATKTRLLNKQLINIGGVLYKSTKTKLCRTKEINKTITSVKKLTKCVITVEGNKYIMDENGKTLKRIATSKSAAKTPLKRLNIGGVMYISKNASTLIRANNTPRNKYTSIRNKSLGQLKINNMPCLLFQRNGQCKRHNVGKCQRVHDEKRVAICKRYLKGICTDDACLMSHQSTLEKMPVCLHYLSGNCVRDECPYLHVKHSKATPVCPQFLQGYCVLAGKCKRRHVFACPEFEETGKCTKRKCTFPHKTTPVKPTRQGNIAQKRKPQETNNDNEVSDKSEISRYYTKSMTEGEILTEKSTEESESDFQKIKNDTDEVSSNDYAEITEPTFKRPKLGPLPCFIPL